MASIFAIDNETIRSQWIPKGCCTKVVQFFFCHGMRDSELCVYHKSDGTVFRSLVRYYHLHCTIDDSSIPLNFNCYLFLASDLQPHSPNPRKVAFGEDVQQLTPKLFMLGRLGDRNARVASMFLPSDEKGEMATK